MFLNITEKFEVSSKVPEAEETNTFDCVADMASFQLQGFKAIVLKCFAKKQ